MGRIKLFGDEDDTGDVSKIEINHKYAKRYEHNKKREELQRYEELKKNGRIDDSGSDSDESSFSDEEEVLKPSKKTETKFFDALIKIKNQDPVLKDKDGKLFDNEDESDSNSENEIGKGEKGKKPMYLKDVVSKQLIEAGPEFDDEEEDEEEEENGGVNRVKSYSEEQDEFRRGILQAIEEEEEDSEGDVFRVKEGEEIEEEEEEAGGIGNKLDEYFGEDEKLDEETKFLKDYFKNRMWVDEGKSKVAIDDEIEFSEDEEEIEKQEEYERGFNFRFEENTGDRVMGHSRKVEGSVRKKENTRKLQRDRKEERMVQAEFERKEELKHLKNLKKKEINEKLTKIREVAGINDTEGRSMLDSDYLDEEFDPEEYDKKMKDAFGEEYYNAEDANPDFGSESDENPEDFEKPDFEKEDEELGINWNESGKGFASARQRILENGENGLKRKHENGDVEKAIRDELMDEYYKLDYEDTVGDLKTRFKYRPVKAKRYGLSPEEILTIDEKDLNQYVSLKKMAPYREKEWTVPRIKTVQLKRMLLNGPISKDKKKVQNGGQEKSDVSEPNESNADVSRRSKRRHRQNELNVPLKRLMAYGKIPSKSKSKKQ